MELNENELDKVLGGVSREVGEEEALKNESLFRHEKIEELKKEKEKLLDNKTNIKEFNGMIK